jgi:hypothetical protein
LAKHVDPSAPLLKHSLASQPLLYCGRRFGLLVQDLYLMAAHEALNIGLQTPMGVCQAPWLQTL